MRSSSSSSSSRVNEVELLLLRVKIVSLHPEQSFLLPALDLFLNDRTVCLDPQHVLIPEELSPSCLVPVLQVGPWVRVATVSQEVGLLLNYREFLGLEQI